MVSAFPTTAMVLAAGLGKRMRPLTEHLPKPLVPVAGKPLIDHTLDWLAGSGVARAVVNTHYLAPMLEAYVSRRPRPAITISHEDILLETGGGIFKALPMLGPQAFFVANSDAICVDGEIPSLKRLHAVWDEGIMDALLLLHPRESAIGYDGPGDFFLEESGMLRRRGDAASAPYVYTGVQLLHPRLFAGAPEGPFSMNILYNRHAPRVRALVHDGAWLHVGDPTGLALAERFFAQI